MGLFLSNRNSGSDRWGVWRIEEPVEELEARIPDRIRRSDPLLCKGIFPKKAQRLAVRVLLQELFPRGAPIRYQGRKPFLEDPSCNISITHDPEFVGIQITSRGKPAGIDLQKRKTKQLKRVAHRFLNEKELLELDNMGTEEKSLALNILWCAKEVLYKVAPFSLRDSMHVEPFRIDTQGSFSATVGDGSGKRSDFHLAYRSFGEHHLVHILDGDFI